jgi:hypothetical protein
MKRALLAVLALWFIGCEAQPSGPAPERTTKTIAAKISESRITHYWYSEINYYFVAEDKSECRSGRAAYALYEVGQQLNCEWQ